MDDVLDDMFKELVKAILMSDDVKTIEALHQHNDDSFILPTQLNSKYRLLTPSEVVCSVEDINKIVNQNHEHRLSCEYHGPEVDKLRAAGERWTPRIPWSPEHIQRFRKGIAWK